LEGRESHKTLRRVTRRQSLSTEKLEGRTQKGGGGDAKISAEGERGRWIEGFRGEKLGF